MVSHLSQKELNSTMIYKVVKYQATPKYLFSSTYFSPNFLQFFFSFFWLLPYWHPRIFLEHAKHRAASDFCFLLLRASFHQIFALLCFFLHSSFQIVLITEAFSKHPYKIVTLLPKLPNPLPGFIFLHRVIKSPTTI